MFSFPDHGDNHDDVDNDGDGGGDNNGNDDGTGGDDGDDGRTIRFLYIFLVLYYHKALSLS